MDLLGGRDSLLALAERLYAESARLGIPSIQPEDALVLHGVAAASLAASGAGLVLDLGSGIGYSTAWLAAAARGVCRGCRVLAVERDPVLYSHLRRYAGEIEAVSGVRVEAVEGDALEALRRLPRGSVGFAFVDIDKEQYPRAAEALAPLLAPGASMAFHNAYLPAPPSGFWEALRRTGLPYTVVPTRLGIAVATKPAKP